MTLVVNTRSRAPDYNVSRRVCGKIWQRRGARYFEFLVILYKIRTKFKTILHPFMKVVYRQQGL